MPFILQQDHITMSKQVLIPSSRAHPVVFNDICHSARLCVSLLDNESCCVFALQSSTVFFSRTITSPAGLIEYRQSSVQTSCFTVTQMHPFIAGMDGSNECEMVVRLQIEGRVDLSGCSRRTLLVHWNLLSRRRFSWNGGFTFWFCSTLVQIMLEVNSVRLVELLGRDWSRWKLLQNYNQPLDSLL